jgi:hypothetical protein
VGSDWLLYDDEASDGIPSHLSMISRSQAALPALRSLVERLESSGDPGAPYEWVKVNRVIGCLSQAGEP